MIKTKITEMLGIEKPVIQGGMQAITKPRLVAAVSNAGGLGIMNLLNYPNKEALREGIREAKALTDKPFGVNMSLFPTLVPPDYQGYLEVAISEGIRIVETAGRAPDQFIEFMHANGMIVMHKCTTVRHALNAQKIGCDVVIADGCECGGHPGENDIGSIVLTPRVAEELDIPVIACGGYSNGRSLASALMLGAEGIMMGTRFLITQESPILDSVKEYIASNVTEVDTALILRSFNNSMRVYKSSAAKEILDLEKEGAPFEKVAPLVKGSRGNAVWYENGDVQNGGVIVVGMSAGLVHDIPTVQELLDRMIFDAEAAIGKYSK